MTITQAEPDQDAERSSTRAGRIGLAVATLLVAAAMAFEPVTGIDVHVKTFPPLHADWMPRVGPGTVPALLMALIAWRYAIDHAAVLPWRRLLLVVFGAGLAWMLSLAFVDGSDGVGTILATDYEYLQTARATTDLPHTLDIYVSRIPYSAPLGNWPVHIAGHPPGALTFFVALVRLGLGSGLAAGMVVTLLAATTAVAVLITLRTLGAEGIARQAAPFLVLGPAAIWQCVSADAMFAAVAAWGMTALALAATREPTVRMLGWSVVSGLLLGYSVMLSYGLPLLGLLALAILWVARSWRPLMPTAAAALVVVLAYAAYGFAWWEAIGVLHQRYWDGVAHARPTYYWIWADFALLALSAGPMVGAGIAHLVARTRAGAMDPATRVAVGLVAAGAAMVVTADLTLMSKAEVERIWLPFVPWLLISCALLPERWRRRGLLLQLLVALTLQHLLRPTW